MDNHDSIFSQVSPKTAFISGLVLAILGMGTIGFVVLLTRAPQNGSAGIQPSSAPQGNAVAAPTPAPNPSGSQGSSAPVNVSVGHLPLQGKTDAPVTMIEFADFRCPFCERFYKDAEAQVRKDYVASGKVRYAFRHFAFLGQESTWASEAAECANDQGKFWQFHDWLYSHQAPESDTAYYQKDKLIGYAKDLGLNEKTFASCLNSDKHLKDVQSDLSDGQAAGVNGTPSFFINGHALVGALPYSEIKAAIDQALAQKQ